MESPRIVNSKILHQEMEHDTEFHEVLAEVQQTADADLDMGIGLSVKNLGESREARSMDADENPEQNDPRFASKDDLYTSPVKDNTRMERYHKASNSLHQINLLARYNDLLKKYNELVGKKELKIKKMRPPSASDDLDSKDSPRAG